MARKGLHHFFALKLLVESLQTCNRGPKQTAAFDECRLLNWATATFDLRHPVLGPSSSVFVGLSESDRGGGAVGTDGRLPSLAMLCYTNMWGRGEERRGSE